MATALQIQRSQAIIIVLASRRVAPAPKEGRERPREPTGTRKGAPSRGPLLEAPSTGQRRTALPRASPAVPSAPAGLASGFGTVPGVPRPPWPLTGGRRSAHPGPRARVPWGPHSESCAPIPARAGRAPPGCGPRWKRGSRARAISTPRLSASPRLHLGPIHQVVYLGPYRKEN